MSRDSVSYLEKTAVRGNFSVFGKCDKCLCGDEIKNRQSHKEARCPRTRRTGQVFPSTERSISRNDSHFGGTTGKALNIFGTRQTDGSNARISTAKEPEPEELNQPRSNYIQLLVSPFHFPSLLLSGTSSFRPGAQQVLVLGTYFTL